MFVVVGNVLAKDCVKVATPEDEHPVKALTRTVHTKRSATALAYAVNYTRS